MYCYYSQYGPTLKWNPVFFTNIMNIYSTPAFLDFSFVKTTEV